MQHLIDKTFEQLKDFQRKTVDYVLKRFAEGQNRFLIADEVGLGKTIVAKGIIAGLFAKHVECGAHHPFRVVYVCSNQAIAQSNLKKLNFTGDEKSIIHSAEDDRITLLAFQKPQQDKERPFSIRAFTPATSFDQGTSAGKKDERILLYQILSQYKVFYRYLNSLKWILKTTYRISEQTWEFEIEKIDRGEGKEIDSSVQKLFRKKLLSEEVTPTNYPKCFQAIKETGPLKLWQLIRKLAELDLRKNTYENYDFSHELVAKLRMHLAQCCVHLLKADLFILDEFQRYKNLIEYEQEERSAAHEMVRAIFSEKNAKILMLSATPFKAYTDDFDALNGEIHHREFQTVLKFLLPNAKEQEWVAFQNNRTILFDCMRTLAKNPVDLTEAINARTHLENFYRQCLVRTERIIVAQDKDLMIKDVLRGEHLLPDEAEIHNFLEIDQITCYLNTKYGHRLPAPLEYAKSAPYALSFMEGYRHRELLREHLKIDPELQKLIAGQKYAWLDLKKIENYEPLHKSIWPNARLQKLAEVSLMTGQCLLLWVPPTLPYYELGGAFAQHKTYTKTLVFSSWRLVPRMIAIILSYEAERLTVGNPESVSVKEKTSEQESKKRRYFERKRHPRPQITFQLEDGRPRQMENIVFIYPSPFLATLYDPQKNISDKLSLKEIRNLLKGEIAQKLQSKPVQILCTDEKAADWRQWYWAAAPILDRCFGNTEILRDWSFPHLEIATDSESENSHSSEKRVRQKYFEKLKSAYNEPEALKLPSLTQQHLELLCDYLADLTLASPAICFLRTLMRTFQTEAANLSQEMLDAAFEVGLAFVTYFNKPESISVVRLAVKDAAGMSYLEKVLQYCQMGNLQAVLDEFVYLIHEQEGVRKPKDLGDYVSSVLTVKSTPYQVDSADSLCQTKEERPARNRLRTHFAVDFSGEKLRTAKSQGHQITIRQAFNAPFAPFVLATTSIGQEGLDFHLYCRRIFHWNLPANAIDIEQREGRIHRYKGHAIRQILASKYREELAPEKHANLWELVFQLAEQRERVGNSCDLIPFWYCEPDGELRIERYVPIYALSREASKYQELLEILALYRLTFGQPRQEELIAALASTERSQEIHPLMLKLSPIAFHLGCNR